MSTNKISAVLRRPLSSLSEGAAMAPTRNIFSWHAIAAIALLALVPLLASNAYWTNILVSVFLFAGLAVAWNIIGGFGGQLSLGHGVYFAIGAYTTGILFVDHGITPLVGMFVGAIIAGIVAWLTSWPTFRLTGPFFAIATLALNQVALALAMYFSDLTGGVAGITLPFDMNAWSLAFTNRSIYAVINWVFLVVCLIVALLVYRSRLGFALRAVREDQRSAAASGINTTRVKLMGMVISAILTAVGGALFASYVRYIDPYSVLSLGDVSVRIVLIVLLGGIATLAGPIIGALILIPAIAVLQATFGGGIPGLALTIVGIVMVIIPLALPRGIVGGFSPLFERYKKQ